MAVHEIKTQEKWLDRVRSGEKRAEVRRHDRDYQVGDTLRLVPVDERGYPIREFHERDEHGRFLNEYRPKPGVTVRVTHILDGRLAPGLADGFSVLSIEVTR